ncbi:hypothetical protein BD847_3608 [Flavobacterium cutihirudinis]|uniref:Uncharacterized protein n=1 Tax=Flavobacterium cutihirudinis TaxID=1265740 RepID=A0A3D9FNZ7_9FLAO|nr:hypothetical protein [Flavobacterium cutihirudinis]RED22107.1 hypothetical protein BD847_3608 [Flavobacterium cutihirudinis]
MKKTALIIALFAFGISFGKTSNFESLPKKSLFSFSEGFYFTTYPFALYDKGGSDTCNLGVNLGRTLYADTSTITEGTQLYTDSSGTSKWTGGPSTYYKLVSGTSIAVFMVNSSGVVTYMACWN